MNGGARISAAGIVMALVVALGIVAMPEVAVRTCRRSTR